VIFAFAMMPLNFIALGEQPANENGEFQFIV
jgi:hypothetical protein